MVRWSSMSDGLIGLTVVVGLATIFGAFARFFRQPLVLAYLLAGLTMGLAARWGYVATPYLAEGGAFGLFADLGIMFLLFLVGLEINYSAVRLVGKVALVAGLMQVVFTTIGGYFLAILLGFETVASMYIGVALAFSSTIIVVKILSEQRALNSLFGRISVGMLLVQDVVALLALLFLSGLGGGTQGGGELWARAGMTMVLGGVLIALVYALGRTLVPRFFAFIAHSQELLFIASIAWVFTLVSVAHVFGLSLEIGGFLAGIALANSSERYQIASRVKALRDFFILLFFVILGASLAHADISGLGLPVVVFSLFVIIGNPLIIILMMAMMGYTARTGLLIGATFAQISEFSFVLIVLGERLGHFSNDVVSMVTAVGVVTILASTYLIEYADAIYRKIGGALRLLERSRTKEQVLPEQRIARPVILVGHGRVGEGVSCYVPKADLAVVDNDPQVIADLRAEGVACRYGDISDEEVLDDIDVDAIQLVISTCPVVAENISVLARFRAINAERAQHGLVPVRCVVRAEDDDDARYLYAEGADYVFLPQVASGGHIGLMVTHPNFRELIAHAREHEEPFLRTGNTRSMGFRAVMNEHNALPW